MLTGWGWWLTIQLVQMNFTVDVGLERGRLASRGEAGDGRKELKKQQKKRGRTKWWHSDKEEISREQG
jgi:hypothetical protein